MSAVAAPTPIQAPTIIDSTDSKSSSLRPAISLGVGYSLTGILGYLPTRLKSYPGKTPPAFDGRVVDAQAGIQL